MNGEAERVLAEGKPAEPAESAEHGPSPVPAPPAAPPPAAPPPAPADEPVDDGTRHGGCRTERRGWAGGHLHGAVRPRRRAVGRGRPPGRWC